MFCTRHCVCASRLFLLLGIVFQTGAAAADRPNHPWTEVRVYVDTTDPKMTVVFHVPKQTRDVLVMTALKVAQDAATAGGIDTKVPAGGFVYGWVSTPDVAKGVWIGTIIEKGRSRAEVKIGLRKVFPNTTSGSVFMSIHENATYEYITPGQNVLFAPVTKVEFIASGGLTLAPGHNTPVEGGPTHWMWREELKPRPVSMFLNVRYERVSEKFMAGLTALAIGLTALGTPLWMGFRRAAARVPARRRKQLEVTRLAIAGALLVGGAASNYLEYMSINVMFLVIGTGLTLGGAPQRAADLIARVIAMLFGTRRS